MLTEFAPGLLVQGFTPPCVLSQFKLIAFDMDSTLINIECVDEIADAACVKEWRCARGYPNRPFNGYSNSA